MGDTIDNLILTDYLEFRWYVLGKARQTARIGEIKNGKIQVYAGADDGLAFLLESFLTSQTPTVSNPKDLAQRMAGIAKIIRDSINLAYKEEGQEGPLHDQLQGFRDILLHDLNPQYFADMYAQTLCYGLFAARCNHKGPEPFSRRNAGRDLPKTNPFLKQLFRHIELELDDGELPFVWAVDDLAELLNRSRIDEILINFGKQTRQEDAVVHFYETFLGKYDSNLKEMRGVYYTPEPVVSYIVRSVDEVLKTRFFLKEGLATTEKVTLTLKPEAKGKKTATEEYKREFHKVQILDPATGTGTFLYSVIKHIYNFVGKQNAGLWNGYVKDHLLPRVYGFELLMASYAVAHLKLGLLLRETGYNFTNDERLNVFLTNTLEPSRPFSNLPLFSTFLANEANQASFVKTQVPIMVVLGNPPYSGQSANQGEWAKQLLHGETEDITKGKLQNYFEVDGHSLNERNPKWLNDDYVKFIRFSQWRVEMTGHGVVAFITNHGYLDNPTFRGMRQSLMKTFDEIYILDLHGHASKKEAAFENVADKNVFDIQQGVAIGIFIKTNSTNVKKLPAKVYHAHLRGPRESYDSAGQLSGGKYHWLEENSFLSTAWQELSPSSEKYLFIPQDTKVLAEYEKGWAVNEIFSTYSAGIVTAKDNLTIHFKNKECREAVLAFSSLPTDEARHKYSIDKDGKEKLVRDWKVEWAQQDLRETGLSDKYYQPILYRPFDIRHTYYTGKTKGFHCMPRREVMSHYHTGTNLGLISARSNKSQAMNHFFCTRFISEAKAGESTTQSVNFPLYLYPEGISGKLFERLPNLNAKFVSQFSKAVKLTFINDGHGSLDSTFGPEDIFYYIYAVLHSLLYRTRYAEFLRLDFPRISLPTSTTEFCQLVPLGQKLVSLHLMDSHCENLVSFPEKGSGEVENIRYEEACENHLGKVYINKSQYFEGISSKVWTFQIGGYQVCHKWLKDRKGRFLDYDDLIHYQQIASALSETIFVMKEIDLVIHNKSGCANQ